MGNKEKLEKCPEYFLGKAKESHLFPDQVVICNAGFCPYNKDLTTTLSGEKITFCKSKGLLKRIELENPNKTRTLKKIKNPTLYPQPDFINGNVSSIIYL